MWITKKKIVHTAKPFENSFIEIMKFVAFLLKIVHLLFLLLRITKLKLPRCIIQCIKCQSYTLYKRLSMVNFSTDLFIRYINKINYTFISTTLRAMPGHWIHMNWCHVSRKCFSWMDSEMWSDFQASSLPTAMSA